MDKKIKVSGQCYGCKHRDGVPGSAHSMCTMFPMGVILDERSWPFTPPRGDPHGVRKGWYMWPLNFDPVWMIDWCSGYDGPVRECDMTMEEYREWLGIAIVDKVRMSLPGRPEIQLDKGDGIDFLCKIYELYLKLKG